MFMESISEQKGLLVLQKLFGHKVQSRDLRRPVLKFIGSRIWPAKRLSKTFEKSDSLSYFFMASEGHLCLEFT